MRRPNCELSIAIVAGTILGRDIPPVAIDALRVQNAVRLEGMIAVADPTARARHTPVNIAACIARSIAMICRRCVAEELARVLS